MKPTRSRDSRLCHSPSAWAMVLLLLALLAVPCSAETLRVGTYNVQNMQQHFMHHNLTTQPTTRFSREEMKNDDIPLYIKRANEDSQWRLAETIKNEKFSPDILVLEESANQADLSYFNRKALGGLYAEAIVGKTNTDRDQHLAILLKPGLKVTARRDQYYLEKDSVANPRGDRLFARGPFFLEVQTPAGNAFWVGVTHMKSRSRDSLEDTRWRNREAKRTHEIITEIARETSKPVILLGDMNDSLGEQAFEKDAGDDAMTLLLGKGDAELILLTEPLVKAGAISFHGMFRDRYRSLIDHAVATKNLQGNVRKVEVVDTQMAQAASDHYPVMVTLEFPDRPTTNAKP